MRRWISFPIVEGKSSRQAHTDLPANTYERELGIEGFFGPATQMYHTHPPTGWTDIDGPLKPRAFDTLKIANYALLPFNSHVLFHNAHIRIFMWSLNENMPQLVRNSDADQLLFIHQGCGSLFCDYGHLELSEGDYILLPRGTMWRIEPSNPMKLLGVEALNDHFGLPDKGIVGEHAIFDSAVLQTPKIDTQFTQQSTDDSWQVKVKRHNQITTITYPYNPLDAIGWHGTLSPVKLNWRDIRPIMSHRYHIPPSVHTTFLTKQFVVCTFCPRPLETDPGALKVPFFHNNDDFDEVIFYHQGSFFSRDNIHPGMITLHPSGITHGPHPKALQTGLTAQRKQTDEVAIMIDTRDALTVTDQATQIEWQGYVDTWKP